MSHYFESGFVVRDQAWHGLAKVLDNPPSVEEGIRAAGLAWTVEPSPIQALTPNGIVDGGPHRAIVRSDTGKVLAVMTDNYVPLQNVEAFEFFDPILQDGAVALEAAGALKEGRNVWVLAKVRGADADVVEGDRISGYLLLSNGHDGSQAVTVTYTPIRVVCWNTLSCTGERRCIYCGKPVGRMHYTLYWWADYHPGHPEGEHGLRLRGQCFCGSPKDGASGRM